MPPLPTRAGRRFVWPLALLLIAPFAAHAQEAKPAVAAKKGETFRVPYQLTDTKHILVRVRINGKGPFHLIMDTGAPAVFVSAESAKKHGLTASKTADFDKFEIEGGVVMEKVKGRVETPFQVSGMNAMNLAGIRLDGMLGYTVLAQYRIELDLTKPHMLWTKLDWEPPAPKGLTEDGQPPPEVAMMGGLVKLLQLFVTRRPDPVFIQRGVLGVELSESPDGISIKRVLPDSPAARGELMVGDRITRFQGKEVKELDDLHDLVAEHAIASKFKLEVLRNGKKTDVEITTEKGL